MARLTLLAAGLVLLCFEHCRAAPMQYRKYLGTGAREARRRVLAAPAGADPAEHCGDPGNNQTMWFAERQLCSLASANFTYMYQFAGAKAPVPLEAKKGQPIFMNCDNIECPVPQRRDCFLDPGFACDEGEYCMTNWHEKWLAWGMDSKVDDRGAPAVDAQGRALNGFTQTPFCSEYAALLGNPDGTGKNASELSFAMNMGEDQAAGLAAFWHSTCVTHRGATQDDDRPAHGRCVKFRRVQQSCQQAQEFIPSWGFGGDYNVKKEGSSKQFERPLRCAPGLACTGTEFEPSPATCVKARPQNTCFMGSWWLGDQCLRTDASAPAAGLSPDLMLVAVKTSMHVFSGAIGNAGSCQFWDYEDPIGKFALATRRQLFNIVGALWNADVFGAPPSFASLEESINVIKRFGKKACYLAEATMPVDEVRVPTDANEIADPVLKAIVDAFDMSFRPQHLWSLVHVLTFNLPDQLTFKQATASRALATWLSNNFVCTDCMGFFTIGILETYGPPPESLAGIDHAKWWWFGHNVASEHVASTRGGHPWINQFGEDGVAQYQNPYYMPFADAYAMWKMEAASKTSAPTASSATISGLIRVEIDKSVLK
jgi:hypothetical protein